MQRGAIVLGSVLAGLMLALSTSESAAQDAGAPSAIPACISVSSEARYVPYGYNHIVILKSGCSKPATCSVATDVNPQAVASEVPAGTIVEVQTFNASPSQTFVARVSCKLH